MPGCQYCTERETISCYGGLHIFIYIYIYSYFALGLQPGIITSHTKNSTTASLNKLKRESYNRYSADDNFKYISLKKMRFKLNLNCPWRPNWQRTTFAWNNTSFDQWRFVRKCWKAMWNGDSRVTRPRRNPRSRCAWLTGPEPRWGYARTSFGVNSAAEVTISKCNLWKSWTLELTSEFSHAHLTILSTVWDVGWFYQDHASRVNAKLQKYINIL